MLIKKILFSVSFWCLATASVMSQNLSINKGWKFHKGDLSDISSLSNKDSWEAIDLPHTWNAFDGQDGGNNYYRGIGCYQTAIPLSLKDATKNIYLRFNAVNCYAELYVNGQKAGSHTGGYAAFEFNITPYVSFNKINQIFLKVSNDSAIIAPPFSGDFTFFGGITRDVELIKTNKVHISRENFGSPAVFVKQSEVSARAANISVSSEVKNSFAKPKDVKAELQLKDAQGKIVYQNTQMKAVGANKVSAFQFNYKMANPHLWNGKQDPYLYRVEIKVFVDGKQVDKSIQPLGVRYFSVDPNLGFLLNGKSYRLHGVALHEERKDKGRAISDLERKEDLDALIDMGCNFLRLAHYQHGDFTYRYLDTLGILCSAEIPLINRVRSEEAFTSNSRQQMIELIRQNYNHPSVFFWGISNEINYKKGPDPVPLITELNALVHQEDPTRLSALAAMFAEKPTNWIPDVYSNNRYDGWYYNNASDIATMVDSLHAKYPEKKIGISEYGAGANTTHHAEGIKKPEAGGKWHPEEYQNYFHETYWKIINERPFIWNSTVWAAFDFASDSRNEGAQPGINDKGLITYDRSIKKDAYYFYKANWNNNPMVYITGRRFTERKQEETSIKIYSNLASISVELNGKKLDLKKEGNCIFTCTNVKLKPGNNKVIATGLKDGKTYRDEVEWNYTTAN